MEKLQELIKYIIEQLVESKDKIVIKEELTDDTITFKVSVARGEMGRVIGKNGLTANSIRGVMQAAGVKDRLNVNVEFVD